MKNEKLKIVNILIIVGLVFLPGFGLAQGDYRAPETMDEAKTVGMKILGELPSAMKKVWEEEAWPYLRNFWEKMWEWAKPIIEPWWQKFLGLLGKEVEKRKPGLEQQLQKEKEEMQKDLWERFKELLD